MGEPVRSYHERLEELGREVAEELDAMPHDAVISQARARIARGEWRGGLAGALGARASRRWVPAGAFALAGAAAIATALYVRRPSPVAFEVGAAHGQVGAWIAAPPGAAVPLRFADGSRFELASGGRARVASATVSEARLVLESGALSGESSRADNAPAWAVTAGPFELAVRGARFETAWDPEHEVLEARVLAGRVVVTGPHASEGVAVKTGDRLRVSLREAKLVVTAAPPASSAPDAAAPGGGGASNP